EGFTHDRIVESREEREAQMRRAIAQDPSLAKYAATLDEIARLNAEQLRTRERDLVLGLLTRSQLYGQALTISRLANERPKKDLDRRTAYQERNWATLQTTSDRAQRTLDPGSDRAILRFFLSEAAKLPAGQRIKPVDDAVSAAGGLDALLDKLYGSTQVGSQEARKAMLGETAAQLKARNDAMLSFASSLVPLLESVEERERVHSGAMSRLRPGYFEVLRKVSGGNLYPDANSTLRVTFGKVTGYKPAGKDATYYTPQTTLTGLVTKEKGEEPFANPPALLTAAKDAQKTAPYVDRDLRDVPVNFLSTCDTTGGNSGSPTLNAKGEFIGLLFDGNYESIDADFLFNEADTRSIHVDSVYMLWVMDAVDGAHNLMRELGVEPKFGAAHSH
ncbi:MAG TPA: S46 family peptidase, partial [Thermoanaerobaculia bacterium]